MAWRVKGPGGSSNDPVLDDPDRLDLARGAGEEGLGGAERVLRAADALAHVQVLHDDAPGDRVEGALAERRRAELALPA